MLNHLDASGATRIFFLAGGRGKELYIILLNKKKITVYERNRKTMPLVTPLVNVTGTRIIIPTEFRGDAEGKQIELTKLPQSRKITF